MSLRKVMKSNSSPPVKTHLQLSPLAPSISEYTISSRRPDSCNGIGRDTILEFCCDPDSNMGNVGAELGVKVIRFY